MCAGLGAQCSLRHMQFIAAGKPRPAGYRWGENNRAVSIQRHQVRPSPSCSGQFRQDQGNGNVEERAGSRIGCRAMPTAEDVGRAGPASGRRSCSMSTLERSCNLKQPPNHGLYICLPYPPNSTTNPGSYSYSQPSSRAVGSWAGPVRRARLTIAARDSRRAFGAVGLYVWWDLGSR